MSEEILKALMQLFAIISKQDDGVNAAHREFVATFLALQLTQETVHEYLKLYDEHAASGSSQEEDGEKRSKLTSMKDSVRTLAICKKINKTLTQKQKVVVLIRLLELVKVDNGFTQQRMQIIDTVSTVFNINAEETKLIRNFIVNDDPYAFESHEMLVIDDKKIVTLEYVKGINHIQSEGLAGTICIICVPSVNLYFLRYTGSSDIFLNGLPVNGQNVYLFAPGSTIRLPRGTVYYSDVVTRFRSDDDRLKLSFKAKNVHFAFPSGAVGLRDISISEGAGKLVGIMGASGAGKTTLLNILAGLERPTSGSVTINGINIHTEKQKAEGIIGYISQDDLLLEELTVFQNLYYNAKLCFRDMQEQELNTIVLRTLGNLGLLEIKDIKVGSPLNKKISGGQRKRLNIALELIREPSVLFVDEPTSGLSSRDSENVMDLLKELSLKGKLIFVVIHQPSSDIFKMFDKLFLLDVGGYPIYYGNPIEAVMYFKRAARQVNSDVGECHACGSVNPELLFNIIEAHVVDEYGCFTPERKVSPQEWNQLFLQHIKQQEVEEVNEKPPRTFNIPGKMRQAKIFITRDLLSKLGNSQYLLISLLEAPLLAFILSFIIRYISDPASGVYVFRNNENVPAYIFMCIIVSLFIGLTMSAEEIFKDQKILKREKFLNLSRSSYLLSKIAILFFISALQTLTFVLIGNSIIGIKGMYFDYWLMLFSTACFANMLGLNISSSFSSAVTIYILIPLLVIPQMILGGAMFSYDKLNQWVGGGTSVPPVADVMTSRWAFEGLMVDQFMSNNFEKSFYRFDKPQSVTNYKLVYYVPELMKLNEASRKAMEARDNAKLEEKLAVLSIEIRNELKNNPAVPFTLAEKLVSPAYSKEVADSVARYLDRLSAFYTDAFSKADNEKNLFQSSLQETKEGQAKFARVRDEYSNDYLSDIVKKVYAANKVVAENGRLIQVIDPVFMDPPKKVFSFRTHFYAPVKYFAGAPLSTFLFNVIVIWIMTIVLYITLYYDLLRKVIGIPSKAWSRRR